MIRTYPDSKGNTILPPLIKAATRGYWSVLDAFLHDPAIDIKFHLLQGSHGFTSLDYCITADADGARIPALEIVIAAFIDFIVFE